MSQETFPHINYKVVRVTKLDACGIPDWGDSVYASSTGWVSIAVSYQYDDGTELLQRDADGSICVQREAKAELTRINLSGVFCNVQPEVYTAVTTALPVTDPDTGKVIGFRVNTDVKPRDKAFALEVWAYAEAEAACDESGNPLYAYTVWPFLGGGRFSDYTIQEGLVTFGFEQAFTRKGSGWGNGPYEVVTDEAAAAAVLNDSIAPADIQYGPVLTTVAPPTTTEGFLPLDDPAESDATGATAGIPGVWTPAGSVRPFDLAELISEAPTASPLTNWTTGQHVILGDGSHAKWNATAWIATT